MIKHLVFFKLKEKADGRTKQENARKIKEELDALPAQIEQIKYYEVGINFSESPRAWDVSLISGFNSEEDLEIYSNHPVHRKLVDFILEVSEDIAAVDYFVK